MDTEAKKNTTVFSVPRFQIRFLRVSMFSRNDFTRTI